MFVINAGIRVRSNLLYVMKMSIDCYQQSYISRLTRVYCLWRLLYILWNVYLSISYKIIVFSCYISLMVNLVLGKSPWIPLWTCVKVMMFYIANSVVMLMLTVVLVNLGVLDVTTDGTICFLMLNNIRKDH